MKGQKKKAAINIPRKRGRVKNRTVNEKGRERGKGFLDMLGTPKRRRQKQDIEKGREGKRGFLTARDAGSQNDYKRCEEILFN